MTKDLHQAEILFILSGILRDFLWNTTNCLLPILLFQIVDISLERLHISKEFLQISSMMSHLEFRRGACEGVLVRGCQKYRLCF